MTTLLIVDDDEDIIDALLMAYESRYRVITAYNGEKALEAVDRDHPDVILLDVMMPVLDGVETIKRLRASGNQVPVIVSSAGADARVLMAPYGVRAFVPKPVDLKLLTAEIEAAS